MYTPGLNTLLAIQPVSPLHWLQLLGVALGLLLVMERYKGVAPLLHDAAAGDQRESSRGG